MSALPDPRNIRHNWKVRPIGLLQAAAELSVRYKFIDTFGMPIEARAWEMARGWRKGMLKRVDVAFDDKGTVRIVSLRLVGNRGILRLGELAAV